jgi:hypothetical protein
MKQLTFLFFLLSSIVFSQKKTESFTSVKLGESREITIGLPASYEKKQHINLRQNKQSCS